MQFCLIAGQGGQEGKEYCPCSTGVDLHRGVSSNHHRASPLKAVAYYGVRETSHHPLKMGIVHAVETSQTTLSVPRGGW